MDKVGITVALNRLARSKNGQAASLYGRLMGSWGQRPDRRRVTVKLGEQDIQCLESLSLNGILGRDVLPSGWIVTYRYPKKKGLEVRVHTKQKPLKQRIFKIGGKKLRLVAVAVKKVDSASNKEAVRMAASKTRKKKVVDDDELEDLEGLEDLDELEDEDLEDEEPDDEDEDEDEDEEPAPKRRSRAAKSKTTKAATKSKSRKRKAVEEDDEDEDDEDEDEPPSRKRSSAKGKAAPAKSKARPAAKSTSKAKNGKGSNLPATRELARGQVGPVEIAEMVGGDCDDRYVRIWLRESDYEREDGKRWSFGKGEARTIAKEIKRDRRAHGAE